MSCLGLDRLYRYLDRDLIPEEAAEVEVHLAGCPRCQEEIELRRTLAQAASSLPDLEVPADFTETVMGRIIRAEVPRKSWLAILGIGLGTLGISLGTLILASGQSAMGLLQGFGRDSLRSLQTVFLLVLKFFKVILLAARVLPELAETGIRGMSSISASFPAGILAFSAVLMVILISTCVLGFRRRLFVRNDIGEDL
jgi:hypothetical protein